MPETAKRTDPYPAFRFKVEVDGLIVGGFSEVSGLQLELETEDYQEGGNNEFVHKLPKAMKYPNLVLKRGMTDSDTLWGWQVEASRGQISRKTVHILLCDDQGNETWSWRCLDAYPVKWTGPDLKGDATQVAVESLELVHCGIRK